MARKEQIVTPKLIVAVTSEMTSWALLRGQLAFLRKAGFDVTLVASPGRFLEEAAAREGVKAIKLPMAREPRPLADLVSLAGFVRLFRRLKPDIAHVSTPKAGLLAGIAALIAGIPIRLYTLRGMRADGAGGLAFRILRFFEKICCACAMRVYCVSESLRQRALDLKLAAPDKFRVLASGSSNGVDSERFARSEAVLAAADGLRRRLNITEGADVLLFVGRLVKDKGFLELAGAWSALRDEFPGLRLLVVGPRENFDAVPDDVCRAMGNDPRVIFTGFMDDTAPAYALADILVLPTYREGFPNVALEAAAMELPVVATRVTG
ncbi:MAG: glycosyltransferase, partial [Planctomycetota bacterium]|nr:glycosyltransferase [Planctomycetota bacterium]